MGYRAQLSVYKTSGVADLIHWALFTSLHAPPPHILFLPSANLSAARMELQWLLVELEGSDESWGMQWRSKTLDQLVLFVDIEWFSKLFFSEVPDHTCNNLFYLFILFCFLGRGWCLRRETYHQSGIEHSCLHSVVFEWVLVISKTAANIPLDMKE